MNETKFKIGDRVRVIADIGTFVDVAGKTGTVRVITIKNDIPIIGVEFDENVKGHTLGLGEEYCKSMHGLNCLEKHLEPITADEKIVITSDGKTTTAKLYEGKKLVKSAEAVCSPDDKFDFERGAGIAINRLLEWDFVPVEEEPYYNGKVVCISNGCYETAFTVGKIYEITEGELKAESCAYLTEIKKVSDINEHFKREGVKFLEIVE